MNKEKIMIKELMQTNFDLEDIFKEVNLPLNGIFCRDEIPTLKIGNYIFNTGLSNQKIAGHWVCCKVYKDFILYWDSFGIGPMDELVKKSKKKNIYYNDKICQFLTASSCGYWCVAFFLWLDKVKNGKNILDHYQEFIDKFDSKNQLKNEKILESFLEPF
jgi:hypothetical protein